MKILFLGIAVSSFGFLVSCSKSSKSTPAASSGSDSVLYSNWLPLALQITQPTSDSIYEQDITASAITTDVLNKGAVNVYVNGTGSGGTYVSGAADAGYYPSFSPSTIYLDAYGANGAAYSLVRNLYFDSVRYVVIPGRFTTTNLSGEPQTYTAAQLKQLDYAALSKVLGIPAHGSSLMK